MVTPPVKVLFAASATVPVPFITMPIPPSIVFAKVKVSERLKAKLAPAEPVTVPLPTVPAAPPLPTCNVPPEIIVVA